MVLKSFCYPNALNIFLTRSCNLNCCYCFVNKGGKGHRTISLTSLKKGIDQFFDYPGHYKTISFNGGEPTLKFAAIKQAHAYIRNNYFSEKRKIVVAVMTNGTLLNQVRLAFLKHNGFVIKVSIDGDKNTHDRNRPFRSPRHADDSTYLRIMNNIKMSRSPRNKDKPAEHKICASLVFTPTNARTLLKNIKSLWEKGFDYIDFYPDLYSSWDSKQLNAVEAALQNFGDYYADMLNNAHRQKKDIFENSLLHTFTEERDLFKPISCQKIHLDWKGNFYCCDKIFSLDDRQKAKYMIGNTEKGVNNNLRLKILQDIRNEIIKTTGVSCANCQYVKYCFCPIGHYIYFTTFGKNFKKYFHQFCFISKTYVKHLLKIESVLSSNPLFRRIYLPQTLLSQSIWK